MLGFRDKTKMVDPERALPGREAEMPVAARHAVLGTPMKPPFPDGFQQLVVGMGCFWGAEKTFWQLPGVYTTAVGYAGGLSPNPTYEEVCSGSTGHAEVVLVVFDPKKLSLEACSRRSGKGTIRPRGCDRETTSEASTGPRSTTPLTPSAKRPSRPEPPISNS